MKSKIKKYTIKKKDKVMLLLIDFQEKIGPQIKDFDNITDKSVILKKAFDLFDLKTLATEQYSKGLGRTDKRLLNLLKKDQIVDKNTFNSYTKEVKDFVHENDIKEVVIAGAETHVCVYQTVRALLDDGLKVYLVKDCISSFNEELKIDALDNLKDMGAVVVNLEILLFDLIDGKDDSNFKDISNFVKECRKIK